MLRIYDCIIILLTTASICIGHDGSRMGTESFGPSCDNNISPNKLEETIKGLVKQLKDQGIPEDEILARAKKEIDERKYGRSYGDDLKGTCGTNTLHRCRRQFEPISGHVCNNIELLEPRGPFCNCLFCSDKSDVKKDVRETDFDEMEEIKSEASRVNPPASVYQEKWKPSKSSSASIAEDRNEFDKPPSPPVEEMPKRNLFSCQKTESIFEGERPVLSSDPDFLEQLKAMTEEDNPSLGILKYHQKRSREEDEGEL